MDPGPTVLHWGADLGELELTEEDAFAAVVPALALTDAACREVYASSGYETSARNFPNTTLKSDNVFGDDGGIFGNCGPNTIAVFFVCFCLPGFEPNPAVMAPLLFVFPGRPLMSMPRFVATLFPVTWVLADLTEARPRARRRRRVADRHR